MTKATHAQAVQAVLNQARWLVRRNGCLAGAVGPCECSYCKLRGAVKLLDATPASPADSPPLMTFDRRAADALADEVGVLIYRKVIDARSPAGDALLDYRQPPSSPRADRLAGLEAQVANFERRGELLDTGRACSAAVQREALIAAGELLHHESPVGRQVGHALGEDVGRRLHAAIRARLASGHTELCDAVMGEGKPCDCGHDALAEAFGVKP